MYRTVGLTRPAHRSQDYSTRHPPTFRQRRFTVQLLDRRRIYAESHSHIRR